MADIKFNKMMKEYANLAINVGLNLQKGQRLLIRGPLVYGAPISAAPFVRALVESAYQAGARLVDVMWGDEQTELLRFQYAPRDSFEEISTWKTTGPYEAVKRGDAVISISGGNPDLLKGQDPDLVSIFTTNIWKKLDPFLKITSNNHVNWLVISVPTPGWSAKVFPNLVDEEREAKMWETIFKLCRVDNPDPIAAWKAHVHNLEARSEYLNAKNYASFHYTGPGTDFRVGFPEGALWCAASEMTSTGIPFIANLPTEEVFTLPHKDKADGVIHSSLPLNYGGTLIDDFALRFEGGRVVNASARVGEAVLQKMLASDEGSSRLGEVALVPYSSPISQSGLLFFNTLLDENAACHLALGNAYQTTLKGGGNLTDESFAAEGGNTSVIHVDFMVGSNKMDIDGILPDGTVEPVLRSGDWAFSV